MKQTTQKKSRIDKENIETYENLTHLKKKNELTNIQRKDD